MMIRFWRAVARYALRKCNANKYRIDSSNGAVCSELVYALGEVTTLKNVMLAPVKK